MARLGGRRISPWILVGGLLTSIGFGAISMDFESPMIALIISLGPAFIGYSLAESGMVRAKPEMLIQVFVILLSVFPAGDRSLQSLEVISSLAVLLLINAVAFYVMTPPSYASKARIIAWAFSISVFLNSPQALRPFGSILYGLSVLGWLLILLRLRELLPSLLSTGDAAVS